MVISLSRMDYHSLIAVAPPPPVTVSVYREERYFMENSFEQRPSEPPK